MRKDLWYGRKQFEINHELNRRADILHKAVKSAGASLDELSKSFNQLAKI